MDFRVELRNSVLFLDKTGFSYINDCLFKSSLLVISEEQPAIKEPSQEESESIPEYTAEEEREDNRLWRTVVIGDQEQRIDMKAIEPFKKVISHGGTEKKNLIY